MDATYEGVYMEAGGRESPWSWSLDGCESPDLAAGSRTQVLGKSSKHSSPLSYFSSFFPRGGGGVCVRNHSNLITCLKLFYFWLLETGSHVAQAGPELVL